MINNRPDFFIVGAPKCGTTAMAHYLGDHPDVFVARKEMHAFGADLQFSPHFFRRNEAQYLEEFQKRNGRPRAGDASVWYLFSKTAAAEIKAFSPDARIIIMLREPAEMLYSLYHQFLFDGNEHLPSFKEALDAEDDRHDGRRIGRQAYLAQGLFYRETACYTEQVQRYFEAFGRQRVKVILYNEFAADVRGAYAETVQFLGLDPARGHSEFRVINPSKTVKSPLLKAITNDPLVRSAVLAVRPCVPKPVFRTLQNLDAKLRRSNTQVALRAPYDPEVRAHLRLEFAPEIERLGRLLGRDMTAWTQSSRGPMRATQRLTGNHDYKFSSPPKPTPV